jgi:DNA-binding transcriptional ArsR family regulator
VHVIIDGFGPLGLRAAARLLGISHSLLHYHLKRGTKPRSCRHREIEDLEAGRHLRPLQVSNTPRPVVIKWSDGWETEFESISELARLFGVTQPTVSRALRFSPTIPDRWHELGTIASIDDGRRRIYRKPKPRTLRTDGEQEPSA